MGSTDRVAPTLRIPFNRPVATKDALSMVDEVLAGDHWSGDGKFAHRCEETIAEILSSPRVLLTPSGTHALELGALLLDLKPGDEVIVPSFTFPSTANAFALRGARPVFADIRPDTLNLDESRLEALITDRTKGIVPVHYAGISCEMDPILAIANHHRIVVVEDNAHGLFGSYRGRQLGTFGRFSALSFHETKNLPCGEGGALVLREEADAERAEVLREKGTNRAAMSRGETDKYTWIDVGSSFLMPDVQAALLCAQLESYATIQERRRAVWDRYMRGLADWGVSQGVRLPIVPSHCEPAYHLFYLLMPDQAERDSLIDHLRHLGISAVFHYLPLHLSPMGQRFGGLPGQCPVTEEVSGRLLRLPFHNALEESEHEIVIEAIRTFQVG
jgi:dTDP-4-amino-4,6-dideoxygalactose transaminase